MKTRRYTMTVRAEQVEQTRTAIIHAVIELVGQLTIARITLPVIAERAGVSVQTVLRQFGSRDALWDAVLERLLPEVLAERPTDPDDVPASIRALIDHYESRGDATLLVLGQESWEPLARVATDVGKAAHRAWVAATWRHALDSASPDEREELIDLLVVATDVYAWKLWRRDRGLTHEQTMERMLRLATSVTTAAAHRPDRT